MIARCRSALHVAAFTLAISATGPALSQDNKVVFQVTEADPARWTLVLNNVRNLQTAVGADNADVEVVAYGPGITLLQSDSPLAARIAEAVANKVNVVACENTMSAARLTHADMLPTIGYVPSGVVEVMRRQQRGYVYIRP